MAADVSQPDTSKKLDPPRLVLFSGPPGVGKSSLSYQLARQTGWPIFPKDQFDRSLQRLNLGYFPRSTAYKMMFDLAELNLRHRVSVILDAVFPLEDFRHQAKDFTEQRGAEFLAIVCKCSDRALWRTRLEQRPEMVRGWTPVGWDEALRVESYYQPWTLPHLLLDAIHPFDHNFKTLLNYVLPTLSRQGIPFTSISIEKGIL